MIKFENVSKKFKNSTVIKNLDIEIPAHKLVVLIGSSGCGKTTTLKMINRLVKPNKGKIYIDGEDIEKKDIIKLRRNIGYVIQQTGLFPNMTIKENIEIIQRLEKIENNLIEKNTLKLMEMIGLDAEEYLYRYPSQLSGGQLQRIGVARGFANDPDIILMDEPFSALDPITRATLQEELVYLQTKLKKTIVFVTHDMDEAIKIADKICILNNGDIVQFDTPENILKNPINDFVENFVGKNRIWSMPELIKAKDIMITKPIVAEGYLTIGRCIEKMRQFKVDSIVIIDKNNEVLGILTARMAANIKEIQSPVQDFMRKEILCVAVDDNIINLLQKVHQNDISIIPVISNGKKLEGIITISSLVVTLSQQFINEDGGENSD